MFNNIGSRFKGSGLLFQKKGFRPRTSMLDAGYWMLDAGYQKSRNQNPGSSIQDHHLSNSELWSLTLEPLNPEPMNLLIFTCIPLRLTLLCPAKS
jgi:hypothetical protein